MCHSPFSHVDIILPEGCLGASDPGGVMLRPFDYQIFKLKQRTTIKSDKTDKFIELVQSQIGKPFDPKALRSVLDNTPRNWRIPDAWFCSELVVWALEEAGFFPYKLIVPKNRISPADLLLLLNPWIDREEFIIYHG